MRERICPACGEKVTDERARYCPICAAALPELPAQENVAALERALTARYESYDAWVREFRSRENTGKRFLETLLGSSSFQNNEKHEEFFSDVKSMAETLLAAYRAQPGAGDPAALLRFVLVDCHSFASRDAAWLFLAAEQFFPPYLELLTGPEAAALYEPYKALRKKQGGFTTQSKLLKTLKRMARG